MENNVQSCGDVLIFWSFHVLESFMAMYDTGTYNVTGVKDKARGALMYICGIFQKLSTIQRQRRHGHC